VTLRACASCFTVIVGAASSLATGPDPFEITRIVLD
jgi:hypothetical protein